MGPEAKLFVLLHENQGLWLPLCGSLHPFKEVWFATVAADTHIGIVCLIAREHESFNDFSWGEGSDSLTGL